MSPIVGVVTMEMGEHVVREELGVSLLKEVSVSLHVVREELSIFLLKEIGVALHVVREELVALLLVVGELCTSPHCMVEELSRAVHVVLELM